VRVCAIESSDPCVIHLLGDGAPPLKRKIERVWMKFFSETVPYLVSLACIANEGSSSALLMDKHDRYVAMAYSVVKSL